MTTLYQDEIAAIYEDFAWPNDFKPGLLAWSIAEQGRGTGPLYAVHNTHSLHWRDDLAAYYPNYNFLLGTTEVDNKYFSFTSFCQELGALRRFIHRKVYGDVGAHMGSIKELLTFICPAFCPRVGYVDYVLSLLPEAEAELRKIGWTPDGVPAPAPVPVPAPDPIPVPAPSEFHVTDGILTGPNVHYYWLKNHAHTKRTSDLGIVIHGTGCLGGISHIYVDGLMVPGTVIGWDDNPTGYFAPIINMRDGTIWQCFSLNEVANQCYNYNYSTMGIENENFGEFYSWQAVLGKFYWARLKFWEQSVPMSEMKLCPDGKYRQPYTDAQVANALAEIRAIREWKITKSLFAKGHQAMPGNSTWDPGVLWPWNQYPFNP